MLKRILVVFVFFSPLAIKEALAEDKNPSVGVFRELLGKECNPCTIAPKGGGKQAPFKLSYKIEEKKLVYSIQLSLNDDAFQLEVDGSVIKDSVLPFHRYRFFRDHSLGLYGLEDSIIASNRISHYFFRSGDRFYYLGKYGYLTYNTESKLYSALENPGAPIRFSTYRLQNTSFVCVEGQCCSKANSQCSSAANSPSKNP